MKLLYLPAQPMLTKRGKPRKRNKLMQPGRLFFEDGRELPVFSRLSIESDPVEFSFAPIWTPAPREKWRATRLCIEIDNPQVEIIQKPPEKTVKA